MARELRVALVEPAGLVGEAVLERLAEARAPIAELHALAAHVEPGAAGISYRRRALDLEPLTGFDFSSVDLALFCDDPELADAYAPTAAETGCVVLDLTGAHLELDEVRLLRPAIGEMVPHIRAGGLYSLAESAAGLLAPVLEALDAAFGLDQVQLVDLCSASLQGRGAVEELAHQTAQLLNARPVEPGRLPEQIAFNLLPTWEARDSAGHTRTERALIASLRRWMDRPALPVQVTSVTVPAFHGLASVVQLRTQRPPDQVEAERRLAALAGTELQGAGSAEPAPSLLGSTEGRATRVARVRRLEGDEPALSLWLVGDPIRGPLAAGALAMVEAAARALDGPAAG